MQISEFRDLLANDGFAATFQTMGQYRTELLRAFDGLRAQADARPAGHIPYTRKAMHDGWTRFELRTEYADEAARRLRYAHPEASAPGLSVEDAMRIVMANWGDKAAIEKAFAANLTRASAATVAEPLGIKPKPLGVEFDKVLHDNLSSLYIEDGKQQAEPSARIEELRKGLFEARDALAYAADLLPQRYQEKDHRFFLAAIERANNILSGANNG